MLGVFDFIGYSYNFFYVFIIFGDYFVYFVFFLDFVVRKEVLVVENILSFFEIIGLILLVLVGNFLIVFWFIRFLCLIFESSSEYLKVL